MDSLETITRSITEIGELAKAGNVKVEAQLAAITEESRKRDARLLDLEQRAATFDTRGAGAGNSVPDIGAAIAADPKMAALRSGDAHQIVIPIPGGLRAITKSILGNMGSTGASPAIEYPYFPELLVGAPQAFAKRRLVVLENLPVTPVGAAAVNFPKLASNSDSAAVQPHEGGAKSETTLNFVNEPLKIATVAHYVNASKQVIADSPLLAAFINIVMLYGVQKKLENLIVSGNGTTDEISGLLTQGTVYSSTETHSADKIGEAIASSVSLGYSPNLVVMNPFDYFNIVGARDVNLRYIGPGWGAPAANNLWGVKAVQTSALTLGTAIVLDTSRVTVLDRMEAQIFIGMTGSQFTENACTILAELRGQLAVYDPHAVSVITLGAV